YRESLDRAKENGAHSIGFPLISAGIFGYPKKEAWQVAVKACRDWISDNPDHEMDIVFAVLDPKIMELGKGVMGLGSTGW
ncbi:macro domain-containing protein, partial [Ralstonia pseudosolanacearum]|uniref:macro domain-containing protein n=1 Tax=Ralstonia pseudosolanacearum TaxID=1310165 RepID=UPI003CF7AEE4